MVDNFLPVYVVFLQEAIGKPHQHVGSVHAVDSEMALMNARDVFVRRPTCVSLWVAREDRVFARTAEQLSDPGWKGMEPIAPQELAAYTIFQKRDHRGALTYADQVEASSPSRALEAALTAQGEDQAAAWWVIPEEEIHKSDLEDRESFFEPAETKHFRQSTYFHTLTKKRELKRGPGEGPDGA
jgi:ring-1,2-phenylacetyl-CoA epoxidase subunit PaaB